MVLHIPTPQRDLGMRAANWRSGRVVAVHCRCLDGASLVLLPSGSGSGRHLCRSFARSLAHCLSSMGRTPAVLCRCVISFACRWRFGAGFGDGPAFCFVARRRQPSFARPSFASVVRSLAAAAAAASSLKARSCTTATWLILPVVICLSQRLSHACLSTNLYTVKLRMAH